MRNRIAITALSALFAAGSLFGALAKPALADADDHQHQAKHHHAYQNNGTRSTWNNGAHTGWYNGKYYGNGNPTNVAGGSWVNGKWYPNGYTGGTWNGYANPNGWHRRKGDHDRDDRKPKHHKDKDRDDRR